MAWADWLGECARRHPDRMAVLDGVSKRRHSFDGFDRRANQIAHFCEQWVGLVPGNTIGLLSAPSDDVLQIVVAADKLGLSALLLDPGASPEELIAAINTYGPRTVFYGLAQADLVHEIWFEVDSVEHLIPLRGAVDTANFEDIVAHYPPSLPSTATRLEQRIPWVSFAAEQVTWSDWEAVASAGLPGDGLGMARAPLYRPQGLAAALKGLYAGLCVRVESDRVEVIEPPALLGPTEQYQSSSRRNVPTGPSWLPHEFM